MGSVGILEGKLLLNATQWAQGLDSARISTSTWNRALSKALAQGVSKVDQFNRKLTEYEMIAGRFPQHATGMALSIKKLQQEAALAGVKMRGVTNQMIVMAKTQHLVTTALRSGRMALSAYIGPLALLYTTYRAVSTAFKTSEGIDQAMHQSLAIMKDVSGKMRAEMKEVAYQTAYDTRYAMEEVGKAYYYLTSAGLDVRQSLAAMPVVAKFAQAGMFDLSRATDLLTDAQMAMGLSSKDAVANQKEMIHVGDVLVAANQNANATVEQFSLSLTNKGAAAARLYNQSLEDVVSIMGIYASQGVKAEEAGSRYEITLKHLTILATENATAFRALGVEVYDPLSGQVKYLGDILEDLEKVLGNLSTQEQVAALMAVGFTKKTISATAALLGYSDAAKEMREKLLAAAGAMDEVSGNQMTELQKGWEKLSATTADATTGLQDYIDGLGKLMGLIAAAGDWWRGPGGSKQDRVLGEYSPQVERKMRQWMKDEGVPSQITSEYLKEKADEFERRFKAAAAAQEKFQASQSEYDFRKAKAAWDQAWRSKSSFDAAAIVEQFGTVESAMEGAKTMAAKLKFEISTHGLSDTETAIAKLTAAMESADDATKKLFADQIAQIRQLAYELGKLTGGDTLMDALVKASGKQWDRFEKDLQQRQGAATKLEQRISEVGMSPLQKALSAPYGDFFTDDLKKQLAGKQFGASLAKDVATPIEQAEAKLRDLRLWKSMGVEGGFDQNVYAKSVKAVAKEQAEDRWKNAAGLVEGLQRGSAEAYRAIVGGKQEDAVVKAIEKEIVSIEETNRILSELEAHDRNRQIVDAPG